MNEPWAAVARSGLLMSALLANSCGGSEFPATPTPLASSPTVQQGRTYQGDVVLPDGTTTSFNMTVIARGLAEHAPSIALTAPPERKSQFSTNATVGTVEVSGNYATGRGLKGTVQGSLLKGSLARGEFTGTLTTDAAGCSEERQYSGWITSSGIAWLAGERLRTCPANALNFSVQLGQPQGSPCTYMASPTNVSFSGIGGSETVSIAAPPECPWLAEAPDPWVTIEGSGTGVGDGTIRFGVQANPGSDDRQATLRIAGRTVTLDQGPKCVYSISPNAATIAGSGGRGTITVTAPPRCSWEAQRSAEWIAVSPSKGIANGTVTFTVAANAGPDRQGIIEIADRTFTVLQGTAAPQCTYSLAPSAASVGASGGSGSVAVAAPPGCTWSAQTSVNWLTILGASSGSGSAAVSYFVQPNGGAARTGTVQIAGQTFAVTQSALACTFAVSPTTAAMSQTGGTGTVVITTQSGCVWTAQPLVNWIVITDVSAGAGQDRVTYSVAPNFGAPRTGALQVAGQSLTVVQEGCTYDVKPTVVAVNSIGGPVDVDVMSPAGCAWTVTTSATWITIANITGASGGTGGFTMRFTSITSGQDRSADVIVGGPTTVTIKVTQTFPAPAPPPDPDPR